jgi:acyl carrier protein
LSGAIVRQIISDDEEEEPFLVAFIVPAVANTISARKLSDYLQQSLPSYMVPKDYVFRSEFPLTEHDKVDRRALEQQYWKRREKQRSTDGHLANGPSNDIASALKQLWSSLLHKDTFNDNDDFFALGGTSLKSAALIGKLREQLGKTISMRSLHENSCFSDLVKYLDEYSVVTSLTIYSGSHQRSMIG